MIPIRRNHGAKENPDLVEVKARPKEGNAAWIERVSSGEGLVLIGGATLAHFRLRVAQSHVRNDFLPSFWSMAGIMLRAGRVLTVSLDRVSDAQSVVCDNGVVERPLRELDDPDRYPNVAVLQFGAGVSKKAVDAVRSDRSIVDVPSLMVRWLAFLWGADQTGNPLVSGHGIPSSAFVEAAYTVDRIDLTPGLSSASSCPEAIWQSAKWWRKFYEGAPAGGTGAAGDAAAGEAPQPPRGSYLVRQPSASATG
jgi:hypothetical protein